jgi:hypothetical protein
MNLMFYIKYICIQGGPQGAKSFEKEKALQQVIKNFYRCGRMYYTQLGLQCSTDTREYW